MVFGWELRDVGVLRFDTHVRNRGWRLRKDGWCLGKEGRLGIPIRTCSVPHLLPGIAALAVQHPCSCCPASSHSSIALPVTAAQSASGHCIISSAVLLAMDLVGSVDDEYRVVPLPDEPGMHTVEPAPKLCV